MPPRVTLTMIVRDEAATLARCLASVADLVDEIVVVDTGSTDTTRDVAAGFGARVFDHPWTDSFADARNASLDHATGAWAWWLDADEWLDAVNRPRLRSLFDRLADEPAVYFMEQSSPLPGAGAGVLAVSQPRLFRTGPSVRWRHRVHEQILPACLLRGDRPYATDVVITHSGYAAAEPARVKQERNRRLLVRERDEDPGNPWVLLQLGRLDLAERFPEAEQALVTAWAGVEARDPLRRQVVALLARGYRLHGNVVQAEQILRNGLGWFPNDTNLLIETGTLAVQQDDLARAESAFASLLAEPADAEEFLGGVDLSWRGWQARHNLAVVHFRQGRFDEAEAQWRAALAERPDAAHLWLGVAELFLAQSRWDDLGGAVTMVERCAPGSTEVSDDDIQFLRGRIHLARQEFPQARAVLGDLIARRPDATVPRLLRVRADLFESDYDAAEAGLRDVLRIDPKHAEARRCLEALEQALGDEDESAE
jgi:tetratricopeptide (TPR) repeat protein